VTWTGRVPGRELRICSAGERLAKPAFRDTGTALAGRLGLMRGVDVSRDFYDEEVAPRLAGIPHAAGRMGRGSDVIGFDDSMSQDHDWGARVTVIAETATPDLPDGVELYTLDEFARSHLGLVPCDDIDWLLLTGQSVLEVIAGPLFRDDTGTLSALRASLFWYPPAVEAYVVASSWVRIDQELPFIGRTRDRGDLLGSRIITARVARAVIHLTFLLEHRWPPYAKWYGRAYGNRLHRLDSEASICAALDELAGRPITVPFHDRPYRCVDPGFIGSLQTDLPLPIGIGSVEMWCDNVDVLSRPSRRAALRTAYESWRR